MRVVGATAAAALTLPGATQVQADDTARTELKPVNVTIRVLDPTKGPDSGQDVALPVDSPDAEHAIASTTAASITREAEGDRARPVALTCVTVEARRGDTRQRKDDVARVETASPHRGGASSPDLNDDEGAVLETSYAPHATAGRE